MKALKLLFVCLLAFSFSGCFEMNEEFVVKENGTGNFAVNMDMGQLLDMMKAFMPPEELEKMSQGGNKDTTIQMKDLVDTSTAISADKKAILRDGSLRLQMNMDQKLFKVDMLYPFKNMDNLQKLYGSLGDGANGMGGLMKGLGGNSPVPGGRQPDMKQVSSFFDLVTKKNTISRKLNKDKYAGLLADSMMMQMRQMGSMGGGLGEVKLNTVIKLPAAAKNLTGSKAELSVDKKTVMIKNNLQDVFDHPEAFEFSVEY